MTGTSRVLRVVAALMLMAGVDLVDPLRAVGECSYSDPWPLMREAVSHC